MTTATTCTTRRKGRGKRSNGEGNVSRAGMGYGSA